MPNFNPKPFDLMTNAELKEAQPLGNDNKKHWGLEMIKRGISDKNENEHGEHEHEQYFKTGEISKLLCISKGSLIKKLKNKTIKGKLVQNEWRIPKSEIDKIKKAKLFETTEIENSIRIGEASKVLKISKYILIEKIKKGSILGKKMLIASRKEWRMPKSELERIVRFKDGSR